MLKKKKKKETIISRVGYVIRKCWEERGWNTIRTFNSICISILNYFIFYLFNHFLLESLYSEF